MRNLDSVLKSRHYFAYKGPSSQTYDFSSSHVWMWELNHEESWAPKNWCFWTVVLEKTLKSLLDSKEIKPVNPEGNKSWIFIGRLMLKLKLEYFGHLMWRTDSLEKTLMLGKIEGRRKRGWQRMRWLNGITDSMDINLSITNLGIGDGQGSLAFCNPWDCKESDTTERLNWIELRTTILLWATTCWDWKNLDIPGSFADWRNVGTWTNTLINEMQVEGAGWSFWKWLTWPACTHLPLDVLSRTCIKWMNFLLFQQSI